MFLEEDISTSIIRGFDFVSIQLEIRNLNSHSAIGLFFFIWKIRIFSNCTGYLLHSNSCHMVFTPVVMMVGDSGFEGWAYENYGMGFSALR